MALSNLTTKQLTANDWVQAGIAAVVARGPSALRIDSLCKNLGVTKGSFYHHFKNRSDLVRAIAQYWANTQPLLGSRYLAQQHSPQAQLKRLVLLFADGQLGQRDHAMRSWGASEAIIAKAVNQADQKILTLLLGILQRLGIQAKARQALALNLMFAAIGFHSATNIVSDHRRQQALNYLLTYALKLAKQG